MLKLKLQYFSHLTQRANSSEKTLMLGKTEGRRRRERQRIRRLDGFTDLNGSEFQQVPGDGEGQGSLVCYSPWGRRSDTTQRLNNNDVPVACRYPSLSSPSWVLGPHAVLETQKLTCAQTIRELLIYRENLELPGNCTTCDTLTLGEAECGMYRNYYFCNFSLGLKLVQNKTLKIWSGKVQEGQHVFQHSRIKSSLGHLGYHLQTPV